MNFSLNNRIFMKNKLFISFVFCLLITNIYSQTFSYTFQPSGTGIDANINSGVPATNYGTSTTINAGRTTTNFRTRGLFKFDLSSIPANAIITTAKLTLTGTTHSGTNPSFLRKVTSSWDEGTVNWNLAPTTSTVGQLSLAQSTSATQVYTLDVKSLTQDMVNLPATNFGWMLLKQSESVTGNLIFASSDNATAASRPKLEISYCLPMDVKAYMTPASGISNADGALNISVTGGVSPYTYLWSDASTNKDLFNKLPGVYTLTVTDNASNKVRKNLIIGAQNSSLTFTLLPDGVSGKDGLIQANDNNTLKDNNYKDNTFFKVERGSSAGWFTTRGLMEFDLFSIPSNAVISNATLNLYGNGHNTTRPNDSYLYLNSSSWNEETLTWNNQPSHTTTNGIYIPATTSANQNNALNVTTHVQNWVQNPTSNFGWKFMLADEVTSNYAYAIYGSSDNGTAGLIPKLVITLSVPALTDAQRNWQLEETYDQNGAVISSSKVYLDELGRTAQSLTKNAIGDVFVSQTVYDAYGRPAINSLPAYAGNTLIYKTNFMLNHQGEEYNYTNFDISGKINNPDPIQVGLNNTVGTYYSNLNTLDAWQATATNPYKRTHYMADPYSETKTSNGADNAFNASSGREVRNYTMVCGDELKFILGTGNSYKVKIGTDPMTSTASTIATSSYIKATKSITTSPDNKQIISYAIGNNVIATCMSGLSSPDNCSMTTMKNYMDWYGTQSIDIHVPDANKSSLSFPLPTYKIAATTYTVPNADISYVITDMETETILQNGVDYTINTSTRALTFGASYLTAKTGKALFLRVKVAYTQSFVNSLNDLTLVPLGIVQYNLDYGRWSVNYYDFAGNIRKSVSAKGINCSSPGTITMATTYDYSHLGQLIATKSPDEGLTEIAYNLDGQARFTQKPVQKLNNKFSYVSYDLHGRAKEVGEFSNVSGSGTNGVYFQNYYNAYTAPYTNNVSSASIINSADGLFDNYCNDVTYTSYEELNATDDIPTAYTYASNYLGKYKNGQVSKTWNANTTTWYKYDVAGRLFATVKKVNDADYSTFAGSTANAQIKTFENTYDPYFGIVTNSYYQKNVTNEYAEHQFNFDANKSLTGVNFKAGANSPFSINSLSYDKLGRLKRQVIGPDLQGVDYVYTINGTLKAINHPSLDYTKDRGQDLRTYNDVSAGVKQDLFGEILEYYPNDYVRAGTSIEANTTGLYNGLIYGARYKTRDDVHGTSTGANTIAGAVTLISTTNYGTQELANRYTYDQFGQLATSTFGTYTNTTNSFTARTDYKEFGVTNNSIAYDANGNITRLKRNSYDVLGNPLLLDDLTYTYATNTNKHTQVADAAVNGFASTFNYKNQTSGAPGTNQYNNNGEMITSPDENVSVISYYPNGQVKQVLFTNGNITKHFYDDQGQKYKSTYFNSAAGTTKYTWFLFNTIYEYISNVGSFNLKELSIGGAGRVGVYKQDATGLAIGTGHAEYELKDHLGNVRVTFRQGTGTNLDVLSKADYYAFGGQLPGRIWQQSGGEYRYGYQGQEKTQDETTWDNFELRNLNHDLGRWSAPDPYGQFASPYIAMANNPINGTDPDGGYYNMGSAGQQQRAQFMAQQAEDRFLQRGRYSYEFLYPRYKDALAELTQKYYNGKTMFQDGRVLNWEVDYMEALLRLNNDYLGLGLANSCLSSGISQVSQGTLIQNQGLLAELTNLNGETDKYHGKRSETAQKDGNWFDDAADAYAMNVWGSKQREYVDKWREDKEIKEAEKESYDRSWSDVHPAQGSNLESGIVKGWSDNSDGGFSFDIFGLGKRSTRLISGNKLKNATAAEVVINKITVLLPSHGTGITYTIRFKNPDGSLQGQPWSFTTGPGSGDEKNHGRRVFNLSEDEQYNFDINGGSIQIDVQKSSGGMMRFGDIRRNGYEKCWNVEFGFNIKVTYN